MRRYAPPNGAYTLIVGCVYPALCRCSCRSPSGVDAGGEPGQQPIGGNGSIPDAVRPVICCSSASTSLSLSLPPLSLSLQSLQSLCVCLVCLVCLPSLPVSLPVTHTLAPSRRSAVIADRESRWTSEKTPARCPSTAWSPPSTRPLTDPACVWLSLRLPTWFRLYHPGIPRAPATSIAGIRNAKMLTRPSHGGGSAPSMLAVAEVWRVCVGILGSPGLSNHSLPFPRQVLVKPCKPAVACPRYVHSKLFCRAPSDHDLGWQFVPPIAMEPRQLVFSSAGLRN
jgi:hypothetical protein